MAVQDAAFLGTTVQPINHECQSWWWDVRNASTICKSTRDDALLSQTSLLPLLIADGNPSAAILATKSTPSRGDPTQARVTLGHFRGLPHMAAEKKRRNKKRLSVVSGNPAAFSLRLGLRRAVLAPAAWKSQRNAPLLCGGGGALAGSRCRAPRRSPTPSSDAGVCRGKSFKGGILTCGAGF